MKSSLFAQHNLDEIVFANRNKAYGAYAIRKSYPDHLIRAFAIAIGGCALLMMQNNKPVPSKTNASLLNDTSLHVVVLENKLLEFEIEGDLSKPEQGLREVVKNSDNNNYHIVRDDKVLKEEKKSNEEQKPIEEPEDPGDVTAKQSLGNHTGTGKEGTGEQGGSAGKGMLETASVYEISHVQVLPEFVGGNQAMKRYLQTQIHYPKVAMEMGVEGKVVVSFVVRPDSSISTIRIHKSLGFGCDEEALRVVEEMPKWMPAQQNGKKVPVKLLLPISFQLNH